MQSFIISLERERARRVESIRRIRQSGLPFELVEAIDGRTTPNLPRSPVGWFGLTNTEVACYLSHLRALQRIVDYELPYALVLEDDFEYTPNGDMRLAEVESELPAGFSYVCLHDIKESLFPDYAVESQRPPFQKLKTAPLVALGYVISRELAAHVLSDHWLPHCPIDHAYVGLSREKRWYFYDLIDPILCARSVPSTIR
jgi:glycosyl transferase family 25